MGAWQLEVLKMSLYMLFPVGVFVYFNQPQFFEDWVIKTRREFYPPEDEAQKEEFRQFIKQFNEKRTNELIMKLNEENAKR